MVQSVDRVDDHREDSSESAGANDFMSVVMRRKWVVVLVAILGCGLGYLAFIKTPPVFESRVQVLLIDKRPFVPHMQTTGMDAGAESVDRAKLATQAVVISSPLIVGMATDRYKLYDLRSFASLSKDEVVGRVIKGMTIVKGGNSIQDADANVLSVAFRGPDSKDCQVIVESLLDCYQEFLKQNRRNVSQELMDLITRAKDVLHKELQEKETNYQKWRREAALPLIGKDGMTWHSAKLAQVDGERTKVDMELIDIRATVATLQDALNASTSPIEALMLLVQNRSVQVNKEASKSGTADIIHGQLLPLIIEEQRLIKDFGPEHPRVKTVRASIDALQNLLLQGANSNGEQSLTPRQFIDMFLEQQRKELKILEEKEAELAKRFDAARETAKQALNWQTQDEAQREDIDRTKKLFDTVMDRLGEMNVSEDLGGLEIKPLSRPSMGGQVEPVLLRSLAIGAVLGLIFGVALAYMIDLADKSFRTPEEIRKQLKLPVLGHIPIIEPLSRRQRRARKDAPPSKVDDTVVCFHRPRSTVAEAYRSIRTALYFGTGGEEHKVIQVTSADAGDGKTTLAVNLAVSIAQSGRKVCLVDADFRRARIHEVFGVDRDTGMSSVILGKTELPDAIHATEIANLYILPGGPKPPNPSELLTSYRFKELLDVLRAKFDTVILDTPPLLAVTDPCAVAPRVDSVLLVLRITKNVRPAALRAKEVLDGLGAKVVGVVVNGVEVSAGYGHDYGYRRYGGAGYGHRDYGYGAYYSEDESFEDIQIGNETAVQANGRAQSS